MSQPPYHLETRDLGVRRGGRLVLSGVNFRAAKGQALWIKGPNGAGKSTLLRVLAGLLAPTAGRVDWSGQDVMEDLQAHQARLHYAGHRHGLKPVFTVLENVAFHNRLMGGRKDDIIPSLRQVGLEHLADLPARYLSDGQQRRTAFARILAVPRPVWLLDEPTVGLDVNSVETMRGLMAAHVKSGGILIYTSHVDLGLTGARHLDLLPGADGAARIRTAPDQAPAPDPGKADRPFESRAADPRPSGRGPL